MRSFRYFLTLLFIGAAITCSGQNEKIDAILENSVFDHASIGISLREVKTNNELLNYNSEKFYSPASSLKLITTLTALSELGTDYTFKTTLGYTGTLDEGGTLTGDIVIIGGGDPSWGGSKDRSTYSYKELLDDIVKQIKEAGIKCIDGDIIADNKIWNGQSIPDEWNYNDIGNYFASGAWGININENLYWLKFRKNVPKGRKADIVDVVPLLPEITLQCEVMTADSTSGDNAYIYGSPQSSHRVIIGTIPQSKKEFTIKGSMPYPPMNAAQLILKALEKNKVKVSGEPLLNKKYRKLKKLNTYTSQPLSQMVRHANKHSLNIYCDAMYRMVGKQRGGDGSMAYAKRRVKEHLKKSGLASDEIIQKDGCGLARENHITPSLMTGFLAQKQKEFGKDILKWLPQAGREGTVKSLLNGSSISKNFYLKSGSFQGVLSYSGYMKSKSGKTYSICVVVNNYTTSFGKMKQQLERILKVLHKDY